MRALTMDEVGFVSGGDFNGIPPDDWGDLSGTGGNTSPSPTGSSSGGGVVVCVTFVGPSGAGGHACASSNGQVSVGLSAGNPQAGISVVGTNNTNSLMTGTSVSASGGPFAIAAAPGAGAAGFGVGSVGVAVNFAPSSTIPIRR
jgi:hypothetical protein